MAARTAAELFNEFGGGVAIRLEPSSGGRFEVDGEGVEVYSGLGIGVHGIDPSGVSNLKMAIHERLGE
jgi:predicted Rdx family selenoprotein